MCELVDIDFRDEFDDITYLHPDKLSQKIAVTFLFNLFCFFIFYLLFCLECKCRDLSKKNPVNREIVYSFKTLPTDGQIINYKSD